MKRCERGKERERDPKGNAMRASLVSQWKKVHLPMQEMETWVQFLLLDGEGNGNPPSALAWRIPWTEEPGGYSPWDRKESDTTERLRFRFHFLLLGDHTRRRATQPVPQLLSQCSKAWELQLLKPRLPRALLRNERSLHPTTGNSPCSLKL